MAGDGRCFRPISPCAADPGWDSLADEITVLIFEFVDGAALIGPVAAVCTAWRRVAFGLRRLQIDLGPHHLADHGAGLNAALGRLRGVVELSITSTSLAGHAFGVDAATWQSHTWRPPCQLELPASWAPALRRLAVSGAWCRGVLLARPPPRGEAEATAVEGAAGPAGRDCRPAVALPALAELELTRLHPRFDASSTLTLLAGAAPHLALCKVEGPCVEIGHFPAGMGAVGGRMRSLTLSGCAGVSGAALETLARTAPGLRVLRLRDCPEVDDQGLCAVARLCSRVHTLELWCNQLVTDAGLAAFAAAAALEVVRVTGLGSISVHGVLPLVRGCPALRELSVPFLETDGLLEALADRSPAGAGSGLEVLDLTGCDLEHELLLEYLRSPAAARLTNLSLEGCAEVNDACVEALVAAAGPKLARLSLQGCAGVTDRGVSRLAERCSALRSVDLGWCGITDAALFALARHCGELAYLGISGCGGIGDDGVMAVARLPGLRSVYMRWESSCAGVTALARAELHRLGVRTTVPAIRHRSPATFVR